MMCVNNPSYTEELKEEMLCNVRSIETSIEKGKRLLHDILFHDKKDKK